MTDLTIKRINKHSKKYRSIPLLTCDRFLDFKISSDFLNVFNVSERKYKIVSVSGQSGVGKSITMNIIITLLYNNFQKENKEIGKDIRYVEIFKVGDGMEGETSGVNCNIINIDDKNSIESKEDLNKVRKKYTVIIRFLAKNWARIWVIF